MQAGETTVLGARRDMSDLTWRQAMKLLGCSRDELAAQLELGTVTRGAETATVDGAATFELAIAIHAKACDEAWERIRELPTGGFDIQGRPRVNGPTNS